MKLTQLNCSRGAPMGRRNTHADDRWEPIKLIVHHCPFIDGDYDEGGAYWGAGEPLWRAVEPEGDVEFFLRAKDRWEALEAVRAEYPNVDIVDTPRERWFEEFVQGYEEAALWSSGDGEEHESFEAFELADETKAKFREDCKDFCDFAEPQLLAAMKLKDYGPEQAGRDFWLTRCRHGAGYWDRRELPKEVRDALTQASQNAGSCDLYLGDDKLVYQA